MEPYESIEPSPVMHQFLGRDFYVDDRAYVPNKETETLAQYATSLIKAGQIVVDVGTGSGNIGISIALACPAAVVYAVDVDSDALDVARRNVEKFGMTNVHIQKSNYVDGLTIPKPGLIVADLPWGDNEHLLGSNTAEHLAEMPPISVFHPKGIMGAYTELLESIQRRGWATTCIFESGVMTKEEVARGIPADLEWEYLSYPNYSITKVVFK